MNIRKLAIVSLIGMGTMLGHEANAACSINGKVERIWQSGTTTYVYLLPITSLNSTFYHYFVTTNAALREAAHAAHDGNKYVNVNGNATSCPTSGTARYGGNIDTITRY